MKQRRRFRLWAARDGLGAIEFGFIAPFLVLMLLGILDFGMGFWQQMEIANATDAGAQWGMANSFDQNSITSVVQAATNLSLPSSNITAITECGCPSSTGITAPYGTPPSCTACPDGTGAQPYIVVSAHVCYSTIFSWPGLTYCSSGNTQCGGCSSSQISLSAQSTVLK